MKKRGSILFGKRGQVTIFIIVAVLIVALAFLVYFLRPSVSVTTEFNERNPGSFLQACIEDEIENTLDIVSRQGGSINPENFILYQNDKVEYLCYTTEYYKTCSVQQSLLKQHIESEVENDIRDLVSGCFNELKRNYEERAYSVNLVPGNIRVELLPKRVVSSFDYVLTVSRVESERYDSFNVVLNNNLYELSSIANSIIDWESTYGDAETTVYMSYYRDLKVEKKVQQDGSKIYILTDRNTENKFQFASRSQAWPPGYGVDGIATN